MRKFIFLFFGLAALNANAQRMKFKELFPLMASMNNEELRNSLKEFLAEEKDHPNANFRMALVYEKNYKQTDPLTNYEYVLANAEQAKLRFIKAKQLIDEREVKKNNDYYFPVFKIADVKGEPAVPFAVVSAKLKNGLDSAELFIKKLPPIYTSFTKSVNFYDRAVKNFAYVNSRFLSLDDMYLFYDETLDKQLEELRLAYDSAKSSFDRYLQLIKEYPIPQHHQRYEVKPIVTYRLDGLTTSINFLTDKILFWDYETWVNEVRKSVHGPVSALRNNLNQTEDKIDKTLSQIKESVSGAGIAPVKIDKQLIFNLNNYDKQSLALALLQYKAFKQNWQIQAKSFRADTVFSDRNAEAYSAMIYANRSADTLATEIKERISDDKFGKHKEFFLKYYGTKDGLTKYYSTEKSEVDKTFKDYTNSLQAEVTGLAVSISNAKIENKVLRFGNRNVSLQITVPTKELLNKNEPITLVNKKNPDGSIYLSGIYKADKKLDCKYSFLAKVNPDGKPAWIKNFEFKIDSLSKVPDASNFVSAIELTREGCAVIIHTIDSVRKITQNTLNYFNDKGDEKVKVKLKENDYPRKLNYIEKTNSFILILKGLDVKDDYTTSEPLVAMGINALGDVIWLRKIELAGSFNDIVNLSDGNLLVGNFMILKDQNGKEYRTQVAKKESNPFLVLFNNQGDIIKILPVASTRSTLVLRTIKVNDTSINLLGVEGPIDVLDAKTLSVDDKNIHMMFNKSGQKIYSNQ
ncbi:MAG: hypothetical protein QM734_04385 [Cyclobacteriaceae bacterium]